MYVSVSILMLWHSEMHITHKGTGKLSGTKQESKSLPPEQYNAVNCKLPNTLVSPRQKLLQKHSNGVAKAALDNWQPVWKTKTHNISTPVCINFRLRSSSSVRDICCFEFYALAQGNAYNPHVWIWSTLSLTSREHLSDNWLLTCRDRVVSYVRVYETRARCLRLADRGLGMWQRFGDVTKCKWRHNWST